MKRPDKDKSLLRPEDTVNVPSQPDFNPTERYSAANSVLAATTEVTTMRHAGPLPAPSVLAEYDQVVPGLAERIIRMAESQFEHRVEKEKLALSTDIEIAQRTSTYVLVGQIFSFIISMTAILAGTWVAVHGQPWVAGALGGTGVANLVVGIMHARKPAELPLGEIPKTQKPHVAPK